MRPRSDKEKILVDPPLAMISRIKFFPPRLNANGEVEEERLLAVTCWEGSLSIYDFKANILLSREEYGEDGLPMLGLAPVAPTSVCFGGMDKKIYLLRDFPADAKSLSANKPSPVVLGSHDGSVISVEYSKETNLVVSASRDGNIKIWRWDEESIEGNNQLVDIIKSGRPGIFCLSVRGNLIAAGLAGGEVGIWNVRNTAEPVKISMVKESLHLECLALFPDGKRYVYGTAEGKASIEAISDSDSNKDFIFKPHVDKAKALGHPVNAVCFFNQSSRFFMAGSDGKCKMWDPDTRTRVAEFSPYPNEVASLDASASGQHLAIACSYLEDRELAPGAKTPPNSLFIRNISDFLE